MNLTTCVRCETEVEYKTSKPKYCADCRKKVNVEITMRVKKKLNPQTEVGVGSGNHSRNKGETHPSYKTGIQAYRSFIQKDYCQECGSNQYLIIHHKDEDRYNNEVSNLVCLCKSCHQRHHLIRDPKTGRYLGKVKRCER